MFLTDNGRVMKEKRETIKNSNAEQNKHWYRFFLPLRKKQTKKFSCNVRTHYLIENFSGVWARGRSDSSEKEEASFTCFSPPTPNPFSWFTGRQMDPTLLVKGRAHPCSFIDYPTSYLSMVEMKLFLRLQQARNKSDKSAPSPILCWFWGLHK